MCRVQETRKCAKCQRVKERVKDCLGWKRPAGMGRELYRLLEIKGVGLVGAECTISAGGLGDVHHKTDLQDWVWISSWYKRPGGLRWECAEC